MERLLQLFVFAVAMTMCCSIRPDNRQKREIPLEIDTDDYPTEYIEKLINALSPEELERLQSLVQVEQRFRTPSSSRCSWDTHKFSPRIAPDEYGTDYFIIHHKALPDIEFSADICRYESGYHCQADDNDRPTYANCCQQVMDKVTVNVLSEPVKEYLLRLDKSRTDAVIIQKDLYINSRCECSEKYLDSHDLRNPDDVCKSKVQ